MQTPMVIYVESQRSTIKSALCSVLTKKLPPIQARLAGSAATPRGGHPLRIFSALNDHFTYVSHLNGKKFIQSTVM